MPKIGIIALYAGRIDHLMKIHGEKWHLCDGTLMSVNSNTLLSIILGQQYSVDMFHFTLPKLGLKYLDKKLHGTYVPDVCMPYIISTEGEYSSQLTYTVDFSEEQIIGLVVPFEGDNVPDGWEKCNGKVMKYSDNVLLGTVLNASFNLGNEEMMLPNMGAEKYIICTRGRL